MGKSSPSVPQAPDPAATAAAQTQSNLATAQAQSYINNVNQNTPWGSSTFTQNYVPQYDSKGNVINGKGPEWTNNVTLSPAEQQLLGTTQQRQQVLSDTALSQMQQAQGALSTPINTNSDQYRQQVVDANNARLEPMFAQSEENMRARLLKSGITQGSDAWNNEYRNFNQGKNDAYLQSLAQGGNAMGQAEQQAIALRDQPLNEAQALANGSQVQAPTFQQTPQTTVGNTNVAGIVNQGYANQLAAYNAQNANSNAAMGGLFGLGGSILGGLAGNSGVTSAIGSALSAIPWSDARLKKEISRVGILDNGLPVYAFRYKSGGPIQIGLMAQDVLHVHPDAVLTAPDGMMAVNYEMAVRA